VNTLKYWICLDSVVKDQLNPESDLNEKNADVCSLSTAELHWEKLKKVKEECENYVRILAEDYIWHNEGFDLRIANLSQDREQDPKCFHLFGCTDFGDNIEDEWFITWMLVQFTKRRKDITIRVVDTDGQFLLIEAANETPNWLTPENGEFRLYIRHGRIVIIPRPETPTQAMDIPAKLTVNDGFRLATQGRHNLKPKYLDKIEHAIMERIKGMPGKAYELNRHHFRTIMPLCASKVLSEHPWIISSCSRAFCGRDTLDIRASRDMETIGTTPLIATRIRSTRLIYAQLQHERPPNLPKALKKETSVVSIMKRKGEDGTKKALELGLKVASGMEILYQRAAKAGVKRSRTDKETRRGQAEQKESEDIKRENLKSATSSADIDNVDSTLAWESYLAALKNRGWFKGYIEHSKPWKERLALAKQNFTHLQRKPQGKKKAKGRVLDQTMPALRGPKVELCRAYDAIESALEKSVTQGKKQSLEGLEEQLSELKQDDDDKWMYLTPESLDELLKNRCCDLSEEEIQTHENSTPNVLSEMVSFKYSQHLCIRNHANCPVV